MQSRLRTILTAGGILLAAFASVGTGKPKKDDAANTPITAAEEPYIGDWEGDGMTLLIGKDRSVHYKKTSGGSTKTVDGTLKGIENGNIVVKAAFVEVKLAVDAEPEEEEGIWEMTVEGEELTKKGAGHGKDASLKTNLEGAVVTQFAKNGVTKCTCPNPAGKVKFTCTATLKNGKTAPVDMTKNPATHHYSFTIRSTTIEAPKLAEEVVDAVFSDTKKKLVLSCGTGVLYMPEGDNVTCTGNDSKTKKAGTVDVNIDNGGKSLHWKAKGF